MAIMGVSGSPFPGGNVDRLIKAVLKKSGKETTFVNLSELSFKPCRGCAHLCAKTNICGREDELHPYLKQILGSEALVLGTNYQLGNITGFMFNFLTRLFSFHHVNKLLVDKPALFISAGVKSKEEQEGMAVFKSIATHNDQFNILGHIYFSSRIVPCFKCGEGSHCRVGGLWEYIVKEDENKLKDFKFTPDIFKKWEDCPQIVEEVERYGKTLAELK